MASMRFFVMLLLLLTASLSTVNLAEEEDESCDSDSMECGGEKKTKIVDPRLGFDVDMSSFSRPADLDVDSVIREMSSGDGFVILRGLFTQGEIRSAKETVMYLVRKEGRKATHFQGSKGARTDLQARTWNLLNKGKVFEKMVQHPVFVEIGSRMLGADFQLGSVAANTIFPGGTGQEPHVDYPYWDYFKRDNWPVPPKHRDVPFFMNMQATIYLDDFTEENGATAAVKRSQLEADYPWDTEKFMERKVQGVGKSGDVMLFFGLLHHCAMPNRSNSSRTGLILQYLPKYIRPMEDLKRSIHMERQSTFSPVLSRMLLLDYPYPAVLDAAEAKNTEGHSSEEAGGEKRRTDKLLYD